MNKTMKLRNRNFKSATRLAKYFGTAAIALLWLGAAALTVLLVSGDIPDWIIEENPAGIQLSDQDAPRNKEIWQRFSGPPLYNELIPNTTVKMDGFVVRIPETLVKINSQGLRDYEYNLTKPTGTYRILFLGGSAVFGWGVELEDSMSKILERRLNSEITGTHFEVINFGVPGHYTTQTQALYMAKGQAYSADLIIIGFFQKDDRDREYWQTQRDEIVKNEFGGRNLTRDEIMALNKRLISLDSQHRHEVGLETNWKKTVADPYSKLAQAAKQNNTTMMVVVLSATTEQKQQLEQMKNTGQDYIIELTDYDYQNYETDIIKNDGHPNAKAHQKYADIVFDSLIKNKLIPPEEELESAINSTPDDNACKESECN